MFDSKLYYQLKKDRIREYQNTYYYNNIEKWKIYSAKYGKQRQLERQKLQILKEYFIFWKKKAPYNVRLVDRCFIV